MRGGGKEIVHSIVNIIFYVRSAATRKFKVNQVAASHPLTRREENEVYIALNGQQTAQ